MWRLGSASGSSPAASTLRAYSWAEMNCLRTSAAERPRVPGNLPPRIEFVPFAIFMPPIGRPSASRTNISSIVFASRSFRYAVCPLSRCPEPGMQLPIVRPPASARL